MRRRIRGMNVRIVVGVACAAITALLAGLLVGFVSMPACGSPFGVNPSQALIGEGPDAMHLCGQLLAPYGALAWWMIGAAAVFAVVALFLIVIAVNRPQPTTTAPALPEPSHAA